MPVPVFAPVVVPVVCARTSPERRDMANIAERRSERFSERRVNPIVTADVADGDEERECEENKTRGLSRPMGMLSPFNSHACAWQLWYVGLICQPLSARNRDVVREGLRWLLAAEVSKRNTKQCQTKGCRAHGSLRPTMMKTRENATRSDEEAEVQISVKSWSQWALLLSRQGWARKGGARVHPAAPAQVGGPTWQCGGFANQLCRCLSVA